MLENEIIIQTEKVPQDAYWMISYLREDIQDIKQELREIRNEIKENSRIMDERILDRHKTINRHQAWTIGTIIAVGGLIAALMKIL